MLHGCNSCFPLYPFYIRKTTTKSRDIDRRRQPEREPQENRDRMRVKHKYKHVGKRRQGKTQSIKEPSDRKETKAQDSEEVPR